MEVAMDTISWKFRGWLRLNQWDRRTVLDAGRDPQVNLCVTTALGSVSHYRNTRVPLAKGSTPELNVLIVLYEHMGERPLLSVFIPIYGVGLVVEVATKITVWAFETKARTFAFTRRIRYTRRLFSIVAIAQVSATRPTVSLWITCDKLLLCPTVKATKLVSTWKQRLESA